MKLLRKQIGSLAIPHISLYGTFTFFAIAGIYQAIPVMTKKPLWSERLADWHFAFNL